MRKESGPSPADRRRWVAGWAEIETRLRRARGISEEFRRQFRAGGRWKWTGEELIERVERWARRRKGDVMVCRCSDAFSAPSDIVVMIQRDGRHLLGAACCLIPRGGGRAPLEFFMRPDEALRLGEALRVMEAFKPWPQPGGPPIRRG